MTISTVGILGSGIMGSGIAEVAAKSGYTVILRSRQQASADAMLAALEKSLAKQVDRGKLEQAEFVMIRDGLIAFEGSADELRKATDPYLQAFLS